MHQYAVGQPYHPDRTRWPEVAQLRLTPAGADLTVFLATPTSAEIAGVRDGRAQFGWIDAEHTAVLAYRFHPGIPWSDAPYTPHREVTAAHVPDTNPGEHLLLHVVLVDAATGLVAAMRAVTWPHRFVAAVRSTVARLATATFSPAAADANLAELFARYPATDALVRQRADVTCTGGPE